MIEVLKGDYQSGEIVLPGFLGRDDDWNDSDKVPYDFVRPEGRHGSCFANIYKQGGYFLLLLIDRNSGQQTYKGRVYEKEELTRGRTPSQIALERSLDGSKPMYQRQIWLHPDTWKVLTDERNLPIDTIVLIPPEDVKSTPVREKDWTAEWYPLGPTNEQIRPEGDPWLAWVKNNVK